MSESIYDRRMQFAEEVKKQLLDCELKACYSTQIARKLRTRLRVFKFIVAAAACAPFMAKVTALSNEVATWIAAVVPLVAIALAVWDPEKTIEIASQLHGRFSETLPRLRSVWLKICTFKDNEFDQLLELLRKELADIDTQVGSFRGRVSDLPDKPSITVECSRALPNYDLPVQKRTPPSGGGGAGLRGVDGHGPVYAPPTIRGPSRY